MDTQPLVAIAGATASGKSDLALDLAERFDGEVINADALQFYRGMDIGTAKLPAGERRGIPHHLLDVLDIHDEASVSVFQHEARTLVGEIRRRGKIPIAVGGSGLYIRALTDRLEFPPSDPDVRAELEQWLAEVGPGRAHALLAHKDPEAAGKIAVNDERRIVRALEVNRLTGRPFSAFMPSHELHDPHTVLVAVGRERARLHERVERRVDMMLEQGFLEEVARLRAEGLAETKTARHAIGYAQMLAHLEGEVSLEKAREDTIVGTRRLVRKQDTWFGRDPRFVWVEGERPTAALEQVVALVREL